MAATEPLSTNERAELEGLRDIAQRLLNFGGDDTVLMPWIDAHRHHTDKPYIGCLFCRDKFVPCDEAAIERAARAIATRFTSVPFDSLDEDARRDAQDEARDILSAAGEADHGV